MARCVVSITVKRRFLQFSLRGLLGLAISVLATRWLAGHWQALPRADAIHMDFGVMAFSISLIFLTALLAGLLRR